MRLARVFAAEVRDLGVTAALRDAPRLLTAPLTLRRLRRRKLAELSADGFDAAHGTDTAAVLAGRELGPCVTRDGHLVVHYETTSEAAVRAPLDCLAARQDLAACTFVDLGCGKGKPLLVAATYPFRRLVGVDISPACVAVARRNLARYRPQPVDPSRVELLTLDAEDFVFPDEPLVVYLFNPFPGAVLERVVAHLEASLRERPRPAAVAYVNPHTLAPLVASPLFARIALPGDTMPAAAEGLRPCERAAVFVARAV